MTVPSAVLPYYQAGRGDQRDLLLFTLTDGSKYGFCTGAFDIVHEGNTYRPNGLIEVELGQRSPGQQALPFTIRMAESRAFGVTPDMLGQIETLPYYNATVTGYRAFINPDTRAVVAVEGVLEGYVDTITHDVGDDGVVIIANGETRQLDAHRSPFRLLSPENQKRVSAGDTFLDQIATGRTDTFYFGRSAPKK